MKQKTGRIWAVLGILAAAGLLVGLGANGLLAGETRHEGKISVVHVDDDGNRHEETIEYDGDEPRAFLGVMTESTPGGGARISKVIEGTAAADAGLERGDVIVGFNGLKVEDDWDLIKKMLTMHPGDRAKLDVLRDGKNELVDVELGEREHHGYAFHSDDEGFEMGDFTEHMEQLGERLGDLDLDLDVPQFDMGRLHLLGHSKPKLGVELIEPTSELREHFGAPADAGVIVSKVMKGMPAEGAGIKVGDLIVAADGREIEHVSDLIDVLEEIDGETLEVQVVRDGRSMSLDVYIPAQEKLDDGDGGPRA